MKCLGLSIFAIVVLSVVACKKVSEPATPKTEASTSNEAASQSKGASCASVFSNVLRLCAAHPQCAPTVGDMRTHRASFIKDCEKDGDPQGLACASQAQSMEAFAKCSPQQKKKKPTLSKE